MCVEEAHEKMSLTLEQKEELGLAHTKSASTKLSSQIVVREKFAVEKEKTRRMQMYKKAPSKSFGFHVHVDPSRMSLAWVDLDSEAKIDGEKHVGAQRNGGTAIIKF